MWVSVPSNKILSYKFRKQRASALASLVFVGGFLVGRVLYLFIFLNLFIGIGVSLAIQYLLRPKPKRNQWIWWHSDFSYLREWKYGNIMVTVVRGGSASYGLCPKTLKTRRI